MSCCARLKHLKGILLDCIEEEMSNICEADTQELGEAIDMLKDLEKAMYYCTITEAMINGDTPIETKHHAVTMTAECCDPKEGRSHINRKMYMESKQMNHDKAIQLRELEKYMQELTNDMVDMISDASSEEKAYLEKKINTLAAKIGQMK